MNIDRILVLSPHTDDGELGAGGSIARFLDEGKDVFYIAFSGCEIAVPKELPRDTMRKEFSCSTTAMGLKPENVFMLDYQLRTLPEHRQEILDNLIDFKKQLKPELVLVPSSHDVHQDHGVIYWEALRAFKKETSIWGYEHPWNNLSFTTDIFVTLTPKNIDRKIIALKEYKSQESKGYMCEKNLRALLSTHGSQLDKPYAEAFELIRLIYA